MVAIGDICLKANTGYKLLFKNVKHIPDIHLSLISTRVIDEMGFESYHGKSK